MTAQPTMIVKLLLLQSLLRGKDDGVWEGPKGKMDITAGKKSHKLFHESSAQSALHLSPSQSGRGKACRHQNRTGVIDLQNVTTTPCNDSFDNQ